MDDDPEAGAGREGDIARYLAATWYLDFDHPLVMAYAERAAAGERGDLAKAVKLYYTVRDHLRYDPYRVDLHRESFKASRCLDQGHGFCITKATLLAAAGRALGIPTRLGFADVRNHLATRRLLDLLGTDLFVYHGYMEFLLDGVWVKATPAFNLSLCERFGVMPLEFDGRHDSIFHPFDKGGRRHMEYVTDHGTYSDVPFEDIRDCFRATYPGLYDSAEGGPGGDFEAEAAAEL